MGQLGSLPSNGKRDDLGAMIAEFGVYLGSKFLVHPIRCVPSPLHRTTMAARRFCSALVLATLSSARWIVPGARWYDTDGNLFNAHAGGLAIDQDSGRYFWFGEMKTQEMPEGGGVSVYSSENLVDWDFHGLALGSSDFNTEFDVELTNLQSRSKGTLTSRPRTSSSDQRSSTARRPENIM